MGQDDSPQPSNPSNPMVLLDRVRHLIAAGHAREALPLMGHLIQKDPNLPDRMFWLGLVYHDLHRYDEATAVSRQLRTLPAKALDAYEQALTLDPQYAEAWNRKITLLRGRWHFARAEGAKRQRDEALRSQ